VTFPIVKPTSESIIGHALGLQVTALILAGSYQSGYLSDGSSNSQISPSICWLFHSNWRVLTKDQWILQTVTEPYQETTPYNLYFSLEALLQEEIHTLLEKQAIQKVPALKKGFYIFIQ